MGLSVPLPEALFLGVCVSEVASWHMALDEKQKRNWGTIGVRL